jgi:Holliday junction resolvase
MSEENLKEIFQSQDINKILSEAKKYYAKISVIQRSQIFNSLIFARYIGEESVNRHSLKLMINLSFIFMLVPEKSRFFRKNKINVEDEGDLFFSFVCKIEEAIWVDIAQEIDVSKITFRAYLSNNFDYPSITHGEYMHIFKLYDNASKEKYNLSLYKNFWNLLEMTNGRSAGLFLKGKSNFLNSKNQPLHNLFIKAKDFRDKDISLAEIPEIMVGNIGIEFSKGVFIPQSIYICENFFKALTENSSINNSKTYILENYAKKIIADYFGEESVHLSSYDKSGSEQDIIVEYGDYILLIECKSNNFNNVTEYGDKAEQFLSEKFDRSIQYGAYQCLRAKNYIYKDEPAIFFDSSEKKSRKETFRIKNTKSKKIIKIVVTLKDFLNLAESANHFFHDNLVLKKSIRYFSKEDIEDTWVVNIFALEKIFWKLQEKEEFIKYAEYRCSNVQEIEALNSDELSQVGYYISPNFPNFIPKNDMGFSIHLGNNFANWVNEYEIYSIQKAVEEWESDFNHKW